MILKPNYPEQLKIRDPFGDEVWFDHTDPEQDPTVSVVVTTTNADRSDYLAVQLSAEERQAVLRHLAPELVELVATFRTAEQNTRPTTADEDWNRDDEEAEAVADVYREASDALSKILGVPGPDNPPEDLTEIQFVSGSGYGVAVAEYDGGLLGVWLLNEDPGEPLVELRRFGHTRAHLDRFVEGIIRVIKDGKGEHVQLVAEGKLDEYAELVTNDKTEEV